MTREEALWHLDTYSSTLGSGQTTQEQHEEAKRIAIEALENAEQIRWERDTAIQQLKDLGYGLGEKPRTDGDAISRQAAIDEIKALYEWHDTVTKDRTIDHLKRLPSAQPEQKKGKWEEIEVIPEAYDIAGVKTWASKMRCNQCGFTTFAIEGGFAQYYFCPNCGSYNGGEQE